MAFPIELLKSTWQIVAGARPVELTSGSPPVCLQTLEDRVLYDASPLAAYAADIGESIEVLNRVEDSIVEISNFEAFADSSPVAVSDDATDYLVGQSSQELVSTARQLIVIDGRIDDFESLIGDVYANGQADIGFDIVRLDQFSDGIEQITELLDGRQRNDAIHIVSHGSDGRLQLGNTEFSSENLREYESQLASWTTGLEIGGRIFCGPADFRRKQWPDRYRG